MDSAILVTKFFIPPTWPGLVPRPHLTGRLSAGFYQRPIFSRKLTLISAPAGFGKTTLVTEWLDNLLGEVENGIQDQIRVAWLSLDEGDNDLVRFMTYFIAALNKGNGKEGDIGRGVLGMLQSPHLPPVDAVLTPLINEIAAIPERICFVLDDYHLIGAQPIQDAIGFLLDNLPPNLHLVIATREDPTLPLSRLRSRGRLIELRAQDLRFTNSEAADFLNRVMGLELSVEDIAALEKRTEGWIAGLQLAAISMQNRADTTDFIKSFTGSHRLVLDYLIEEVLDRQSEEIQTFLLQTAILERLNGSLCDALTGQANGQQTLEHLENANLFIIPLDDERRWYRYHHLFAELLYRRVQQRAVSPEGTHSKNLIDDLHRRASEWYEDHGLEIEAFRHAAAANDFERAERLVEGGGMPLHFRGAMTPVLNWLETLPKNTMDARPSLWVTYASALTFIGQPGEIVEGKLQEAEAAIKDLAPDETTQDLTGHIAALRAMNAIPRYRVDLILEQSRRALELLHPDNLAVRAAANWTLGFAFEAQGDRRAASRAYVEVMANSQASGNTMFDLAAATSLGKIQEAENQLYLAFDTHQHVLKLAGDPPMPAATESYLSLARIFYQWNNLETARDHAQKSLHLARQMANVDTPADCLLLLARLELARGAAAEAAAKLAEADRFIRQGNFVQRMPAVASERVVLFLHKGDQVRAADLAAQYDLPISQARVCLAKGDPNAALSALAMYRQQVEAKEWGDERLKVLILQALALQNGGDTDEALKLLGEALALAEPGEFIRIFIDEGPPMERLLYQARSRRINLVYVDRLLEAFATAGQAPVESVKGKDAETTLTEPLSQRELDVLELIAEGLTNQEIADRLYVALNTVKSHTRSINGKLEVNSRTQAVARARSLGILN